MTPVPDCLSWLLMDLYLNPISYKMKRIISILLLCLCIGIFLQWKSRNSLNSLLSSVSFSDQSRSYLLASTHLSRAQSYLSSAFIFNIDSFFVQSEKSIKKALELVHDSKRKQQIKSIELHVKNLRLMKEKGQVVDQGDFGIALKLFENVLYDLIVYESNFYEKQFSSFDHVSKSFKILNYSLFFLFVISILGLVTVFYLEFKKKKYLIEITQLQKLQGMIFSTLSESIFFVDFKGIVRTCNESASSLVDKNIHNLIGLDLYTLFPRNVIISKGSYNDKDLKFLISSGRTVRDLNLLVRGEKNEDRWFKLSCQPLIGNSKESSFSLVVSMIDITKQVESTNLIKEQQYRLIESSKMQTIGELAGGIAHEINNPLAVILSRTGILAKQAEKNKSLGEKEIVKSTSLIEETIVRISKTVAGLLKMSRGESAKAVNSNVGEILTMTEEFTSTLISKAGCELVIEKELNELEILCHPTQISQVLINLIKNSIDAVSKLKEKWIKIEVSIEDNKLSFRVTDSGKGISEKLKKNILLPYFTTKKNGEGTGLGLSISRNIIESHKGILSLDDDCKHTSFVVTIPLEQEGFDEGNVDNDFFL